jgi:hypothetical protein
MAQTPKCDWSKVETEYRTGTYSNSELGRRNGISEAAIRKRAKAESWTKDLAARVKERTKEKLLEQDGGAGANKGASAQRGVRTRTEAEDERIVENAAGLRAEVQNIHREDIRSGRAVTSALLQELFQATGHKDEIMAAIEEEAPGEKNAKRRTQMLKAVSLGARSSAMLALSQSMRALQGLERKAFGMDDGDPEDHAPIVYSTADAGAL